MMDGSNDILADRRFAWASAMADRGDFGAAADLFDQVVERVPGWAPGWAALGSARERTHEPALALRAWRRAAALDGSGALGAALHVARLAGEAPQAMPDAYVQALFDDYAARFDRHLIDGLGYRGPRVLLEALAEVAPGRSIHRALDLGCGTGLMGRALTGRARRIDGVDLAPLMVEAARACGVYEDLTVGPLDLLLGRAERGSYDLIVAVDVFGYLGDLTPIMRSVGRVLAPGGLFGFTVQLQPPGHVQEFGLGPDMRFAHSRAYVDRIAAVGGLTILSVDTRSLRTERGLDVPGLVVVATRAAEAAPGGTLRERESTP